MNTRVHRVHRVHRVLAGLAAAAFVLNPLAAQAFDCQGPVRQPSVEASTGDVLAQGIGDLRWPRLCNLRATSPQGITPETCKVIYATLMTAALTGKHVRVATKTAPYASCGAYPEWVWLPDFYWMVLVTE
ncbi:hypothetical protein ACFJIX_12460 [Roseateles sp. UC29_93]|uniref:hypothetical protein n=1 Tax=Roseateles sp. UC29_93 TaxID=3350177 RepID=UPI003672AF11